MVMISKLITFLVIFLGVSDFIFCQNSEINRQDYALKIEAEAIPSTPLFPGQRARLIYRIFYQGEVNLTNEQLPFLNITELQKIGSLQTQEYTQNDRNVQEISQEVRAIKPGTFSYGPAIIEGTVSGYLAGQAGITKLPIRAEAPTVTITVLPFPNEGKPKLFSGAVGDFTLQTTLLTSPKVRVGDLLTLQIRIAGNGEFDTIFLPNIFCQPGFSGFFEKSSLPPQEKTTSQEKLFTLELRPLLSAITAIPSIYFVYFNPQKKSYHFLKSAPIPLLVQPLPNGSQSLDVTQQKEKASPPDWKQILSSLPPITIRKNEPIINFWIPTPTKNLLQAAYEAYSQGIHATSVSERIVAINNSLALYSQVDPETLNDSEKSKLFYNIGNSYYLLEEYAWALFFYERSRILQPTNESNLHNLSLAESKLYRNPEGKYSSNLWQALWKALPFQKYFKPIEGIMVHTSMLTRGPGQDYAWVRNEPIFVGERVSALELSPKGSWIKVRTSANEIGYVPSSSIRLLD